MYIEENKDKQSDAKRRKLKSAVVQPSILTAKQPKDCTESVQPQEQSRVTTNLKLHSEEDKTSTKGKKKSSGADTIENYRKTKSLETERDNVFFNKKTFDGETSKTKDTDNDGWRGSVNKDNNTIAPCTRFNDDLRYIVIDGSNVAMQHGPDNVFSCKGLRICVDFFRNRGHRMITVFLPHWRKCRPNNPASVSHRYILDDLEREGYLVYTPRRIGKKLVASYDDRLLMFTFVRDHFMPPEDPYGRNGPTLSELLRLPWVRPAAAAVSLGQDMYSRLKGLEAGNPRSDRREIEQDFYSCKASRYKCH